MGNKLQIIEEKEARSAGKIDLALPVVPPLDLQFAVPIVIPSTAWKRVPCTAPPDFFARLGEEAYSARHLFEERFSASASLAGEVEDQVRAFHAATNTLGKVWHAILFAAQEANPDPALRLLANTIEKAWLDYNAHDPGIAPRLESCQARALRARLGEVVNLIPREMPALLAGPFAPHVQSALTGARFAKMRDSALSLDWGQGTPITIPLGTGATLQGVGSALGSAAGKLLAAEISTLDSITIPEACPAHDAVRDTIRAKFPGSPCLLPRFFVSHHFTVQSTRARDLPLEASSTAVYDKTLQPQEVAWVMIKSWVDSQDDARAAAFADSGLPEARETLLRLIREPILGECGFEHLPSGAVIIPEDYVPRVPQLVQDKVTAQTRSANDYRTFTAQELPSAAAAEAIGIVSPFSVPTQAVGRTVFEFRNKESQPLHVQYVAGQRTYTITVTEARVGVSCWDDAGGREVGPEKLAGFLAERFASPIAPDTNPVLAAFREASERGQRIGPVSFEVALFQPVAAPPRYFEHARESRVKSGS